MCKYYDRNGKGEKRRKVKGIGMQLQFAKNIEAGTFVRPDWTGSKSSVNTLYLNPQRTNFAHSLLWFSISLHCVT